MEDKVDLEVCLFSEKEEFHQFIELEKEVEKDSTDFDYLNALDSIEVQPSSLFIERTKEKLIDSSYEDYQNMVDAWIEDDVKRGLSKEQAEHYYLNLRTKLSL